ncbi:hypothetical protein PG988_012864 [Apiospora saccharicola]
MSSTTSEEPTGFSDLPREVQLMVFKEAIVADYTDRVVPVLGSNKRVVLTSRLTNPISKYFRICSSSREAAQLIYDVPMSATTSDGKTREARLSTALDIFLVSAWGFTLGINVFGGLFQMSDEPLPVSALAKVERVMEHSFIADLVRFVFH